MTAAAWSGARASMWEVVRPLCVPVLSLDRSAAAAATVTGGEAALTLSASLARCPKRQLSGSRGRCGRLGVGVALRAVAGSCGGGWHVAGGRSGG